MSLQVASHDTNHCTTKSLKELQTAGTQQFPFYYCHPMQCSGVAFAMQAKGRLKAGISISAKTESNGKSRI